MRMVKAALLALLLSSTLTACAGQLPPPVIKTILLYPPISGELLSCPLEPSVGEVKTQEEFAVWTEKVRQAGKECRDTLDGLRAYIYSWQAGVDQMDPWFTEGDPT